MPTGAAMVAGVTGWPVRHSLSPRLHGFWLRRYGLDGIYAPFPMSAEGFEAGVRGLMAAGVRGLNVTVPHKRAAHDIADVLDPAAKLIGAVNTLVFRDDGRIVGRNTDSPGFIENLRDAGVEPATGPALLLGAGGAARGAIHALLDAGAPEVRIINRSEARAQALLSDLGDARVSYAGDACTSGALADIALLVNTTSVGMSGKGTVDLDMTLLSPDSVVHDIVYTPLETALLGRARARGLRTVDGLGMLLHQAVPAFEAFYGARPTVDEALRSYLLEVL